MMKQEFEKMVDRLFSEETWEVIHTVYQFHPAINDVKGKKQMADLYLNYGMTVIFDMEIRAKAVQELTARRTKAIQQVDSIEAQINSLSKVEERT